VPVVPGSGVIDGGQGGGEAPSPGKLNVKPGLLPSLYFGI